MIFPLTSHHHSRNLSLVTNMVRFRLWLLLTLWVDYIGISFEWDCSSIQWTQALSAWMSIKPIELPPRPEGSGGGETPGSGPRGPRTSQQISEELTACYLASTMCTVVGVGIGTALSVQRKNVKYLAAGGVVVDAFSIFLRPRADTYLYSLAANYIHAYILSYIHTYIHTCIHTTYVYICVEDIHFYSHMNYYPFTLVGSMIAWNVCRCCLLFWIWMQGSSVGYD